MRSVGEGGRRVEKGFDGAAVGSEVGGRRGVALQGEGGRLG